MKKIGNILLIVFSVLAVVSLIWVAFTGGAFSAESELTPDTPVVSFMVFVAVIALLITVLLFLIYKVVDILKHPSHLKETLYVSGALVVALIIGLIFGDGGDVPYGNGEVFAGGTVSKLIGAGLVASGVLITVAIIALLIDTVKGILKG